MVQFLFLTGEFHTVAEVIAELPQPIETGYTVYEQPQQLLAPFVDTLHPLHQLKSGQATFDTIVTPQGEPVDQMTAVSAIIAQQALTIELEAINSAFCAPCGCTLCCVGPEPEMEQHFFEIPLDESETALFPVSRINTERSRRHHSMDEEPLRIKSLPFYSGSKTSLVLWQDGWSLILPTTARCPNLEERSGRCQVYPERPDVCRRPQIFPYMLERISPRNSPQQHFMLRQSLLAVVDCPYVNLLKDEIAAYAAACELEMIFKENKA